MTILLLGSGGREHALHGNYPKSTYDKLCCARNAGTAAIK
jgi:phosphoribosylamine-glycine ligase